MAMFQYCDHMHLCVYKIVCDVCLCVCTICCRSVAGFDLHRISISSSTCVCLSELHHITSSCSSSASSALLAGAAPGDASCTCQISQMQPHCQIRQMQPLWQIRQISSDTTTLPDELRCCNCWGTSHNHIQHLSGTILFPKKDPILLNLLVLEWEKYMYF